MCHQVKSWSTEWDCEPEHINNPDVTLNPPRQTKQPTKQRETKESVVSMGWSRHPWPGTFQKCWLQRPPLLASMLARDEGFPSLAHLAFARWWKVGIQSFSQAGKKWGPHPGLAMEMLHAVWKVSNGLNSSSVKIPTTQAGGEEEQGKCWQDLL